MLPYVRTPIDAIDEMTAQIAEKVSSNIDEKFDLTINSLFPIPAIEGVAELEAEQALLAAGFTPVYVNAYEDGVPRNGIVRSYKRGKASFKQIELDIFHPVPDIIGKSKDEAMALLEGAGFAVETSYTLSNNQPNDTVLACLRGYDTSMHVSLEVASGIPEMRGMPLEEAQKVVESLGCKAIVEKVASNEPANTVIKWANSAEKLIHLSVSVPEVLTASNVAIKWTTLNDSSGDQYTATATCNRRLGQLVIDLKYLVNPRAKRRVTGMHATGILSERVRVSRYPDFEPGKSGDLRIIVSMNANDEPLTDLSVAFYTQYGLMNRNEEVVTLRFLMTW